MKLRYIYLFLFFAAVIQCTSSEKSGNEEKVEQKRWSPRYAKGFLIEIHGNDSTLLLRNPQDTNSIYSQISISSTKKGGLSIPLKRITSLSATHLAFLSKLE